MGSWQGQLSLFSPAQHQNSTRTTLLFSHHSYSSQGLLTSLLISLNVLWFGQCVFTVWAKMLRPSHFLRPVLWDSTDAEALNYSSSVRVMLVSGSAWSQISRILRSMWLCFSYYDQNTLLYKAHTEAGKVVWMYLKVFVIQPTL